MNIIADLLHDIISYVPFKEGQNMRLIDKFFDNFVINDLRLDTIVWINVKSKQLPKSFIKKHRLEKLVICITNDNVYGYRNLYPVGANCFDNDDIVAKMKVIVPEFISMNSTFQVLDK